MTKSKSVTPADSRKNLAIVQTLIQELPQEQTATVGMNALGQLADMLTNEDFVRWLDRAIHHAVTGEILPEEDQEQDQQQPQEQAAPSPGAPQNGGTGGAPSTTT